MTLICLETMHFITRRYGEKSITVTVSPVSSEQLVEILGSIEKEGIEIDSFTVTDSVATVRIRLRQRNYTAALTNLMNITKGLTVEIS